MAVEIERKFLVKNNNWKSEISHSTSIHQGYLAPLSKSSVRVRIEGDAANINIKSATLGMSRTEYEYTIPLDDAAEMLKNLCEEPQINKTRHYIPANNHTWEIDEFYDDNEGLVIAEIELTSEDEDYIKPEWLGEEVTQDKRYYNVNLIKHPYKDW